MNKSVLENAVREYHLRQATPESVLSEVTKTLEFARDFFERRGKTIIAQNIRCQLEYFSAAEVFQRADDFNVVATTDVA
jgi:hypothetical protein